MITGKIVGIMFKYAVFDTNRYITTTKFSSQMYYYITRKFRIRGHTSDWGGRTRLGSVPPSLRTAFFMAFDPYLFSSSQPPGTFGPQPVTHGQLIAARSITDSISRGRERAILVQTPPGGKPSQTTPGRAHRFPI